LRFYSLEGSSGPYSIVVQGDALRTAGFDAAGPV
jgi:hypothetical protein